MCMFNFIRIRQTLFQRGRAISHFHPQRTGVWWLVRWNLQTAPEAADKELPATAPAAACPTHSDLVSECTPL